ncbi:MAG: hypothetical protein KJZ78_13530 [Bryobacteraceae bacterium]|nr:hypothetical protein [Bryobacteraceae bacterium]
MRKVAVVGLGVCIAAFAIVVPASVADEPETTMAPLPIVLPEPWFEGTPIDYFSDFLEEKVYTPRPQFMAPAGAANLAEGKPVSSSCVSPTYGKLTQITDGKKGPQPGDSVELDPGVQWVQIDLGKECAIYAIVVWHQYSRENVYFDVVVKTADDAEFATGVQIIYNNDFDNSAGLGIGKDMEYFESNEGRLIDTKGVQARYIRLYSNGNAVDDRNHYGEVEVYGMAVSGE